MKNILFHIGYHKTASSWFQEHLFVAGNDLFHPLSDNKRGQSTFAKYFVMDKDHFLLHPLESNQVFLKQEFDRLINKTPDLNNKTVVVSQERLSGTPHSSGFDASLIANRIASFAPDAKVLIIIREQRSWLLSNYFQYIAVGGTQSIDKYLNQVYGKRPHFSYKHVNYHYLIQDYHNLLGKDNVCVLPYELFKSDSSTFFKQFSHFINQDIRVKEIDLTTKINQGHNQFTNYHLRHLNWMTDSNSLNNYSILSNRFTRPIAKSIKNFSDRGTTTIVDQRLGRRPLQSL